MADDTRPFREGATIDDLGYQFGESASGDDASSQRSAKDIALSSELDEAVRNYLAGKKPTAWKNAKAYLSNLFSRLSFVAEREPEKLEPRSAEVHVHVILNNVIKN